MSPNGHDVLQGATCFRCGGVPVPLNPYVIGRGSAIAGTAAGLLCVSCAELLLTDVRYRPSVPGRPMREVAPDSQPHAAPNVERARGLMLGLMLGDALVHRSSQGRNWLLGSVASQLACFTVDGLIRAHVRGAQRGIWHPPSMVWQAYARWAHGQGLPLLHQPKTDGPWPDGWLYQQAPLRVRRGSAPATVEALTRTGRGTPDQPTTSSAGHHALSNAMPVALMALDVRRTAVEVAALTHGDAAAQQAAGDGAKLLDAALRAEDAAEFLEEQQFDLQDGPPGTAVHALLHGARAAQAHFEPAQFLDALASAYTAGGRGAAICAGTLLGACHGATALPQDLIGRLELGIIADELARDIVTEQALLPAGTEYNPQPDLYWWFRYPGFWESA